MMGTLVDRIEPDIELVGALDEVQHSRLIEVVNKGPVHKTRMPDIVIETRLL